MAMAAWRVAFVAALVDPEFSRPSRCVAADVEVDPVPPDCSVDVDVEVCCCVWPALHWARTRPPVETISAKAMMATRILPRCRDTIRTSAWVIRTIEALPNPTCRRRDI